MVFNTLTQNKVEFVPKNGNSIKWYICGPTGEDASPRASPPPHETSASAWEIRQFFLLGGALRFFPQLLATRMLHTHFPSQHTSSPRCAWRMGCATSHRWSEGGIPPP